MLLRDGWEPAADEDREHVGGLASLLLLADGRFPSGGHAHSGGLEAAVATGRLHDFATLEEFLLGRLTTAGAVAAAFAAAANAACVSPTGGVGEHQTVSRLDTELDARTPSPALRETSRKLGRQLLRAARAVRPHPALAALATAVPAGAHQPIVLGATARALGLKPHAAALATLHEAATGPATAAVRLLGLDPFAVHTILTRLAPRLDRLASEAATHARCAPEDLPRASAPSLDISAEHHATWEVRLFAS